MIDLPKEIELSLPKNLRLIREFIREEALEQEKNPEKKENESEN